MSDVIQKGFQPLAKFCCKSGEKRKNKVLLPFVKKLWLLNDRHRMFQKQPMSDVIQKGFQPLAKFCSKSSEKRKNKVLLPFVKELWLLNDRHRMFLKHPMSDASDVIQKPPISDNSVFNLPVIQINGLFFLVDIHQKFHLLCLDRTH